MDPSVTCLRCRKPRVGILPIYCSCGNVIGPVRPLPPEKPKRSDICKTCEYCNGKQCLLHIDKKRKQGIEVGGWVSYVDTHPTVRCPADQPRWYVGDIGFLSVTYMEIGGTEVFHRTLLPRLTNVAGFVSYQPRYSAGNFSLLGCQGGVGLEQARRLASAVKVLVVWGLGNELGNVLKDLPQKPKIVSIAHCDARSHWTRQYMLEQEPWTDKYVYINRPGIGTVPLFHRDNSVMIPNGIDEKRIETTRTREEIRTELGIPQDATLGVMISRYSEEKRIAEGMAAARLAGHHLLVAGSASDWNQQYLRQLRGLQTDKVRLHPQIESPAELLKAADYYLSLSEYEGFGLSMAEAMYAGVQVVSTKVGLVEDEPQCARIVPYRPATHEIVQAITSPQDTREIAAATVRKKYNSYIFAQRWQELLNDLAGVPVSVRYDMPNSNYFSGPVPSCRT